MDDSSGSDASVYNSALDNSSLFLINDGNNVNNPRNHNEMENSKFNQHNRNKNEVNNKKIIIRDDSGSLDEVDPKSNLANKTIFKTDNPNLSIIEINNDNSVKSDEESVYLIESDDYEEHKEKVRSILNLNKNQHSNPSNLNPQSLTSNMTTTITTTSPISSSSAAATTSSTPSSSSYATPNDNTKTKSSSEKRVITIYNTIEEFEKNLPYTVKLLTTPCGSKVYLVGTSHFSEESQDDVSLVIRNVKPDIVVVELCTSRIHILKHDEQSLLEEAKNLNLTKIRNIIHANGIVNGIFYIMLLHMSANLVKEIGMAPGGEFRRAFDEVKKLKRCVLHLGDRPINITLQRVLCALSLWQTVKLVFRCLFKSERINIDEVEECKQQDLLEKLLQEMAGEFPAFSDVFVNERDLYLCHSLQLAALPRINSNGTEEPVKVVGVVGIGHTSGICRNWLKVESNQIEEILLIPPPKLSTRILKKTIKITLCGAVTYGIYKILSPRILPKFIK